LELQLDGRGFDRALLIAIAAVKKTGRNPSEAVIAALFKGRNPWQVAAELNSLLDQCRRFREQGTGNGEQK
jgi:hypothetical protein